MEGMEVTKEDSKKRGRSETSVSDADTSVLEVSKDSGDNIQSKEEASLKGADSKDYEENLNKSKTNAPKYVKKGKGQPKKSKKAKYDKDQKADDEGWEDLSFKEMVRVQLKDISESLTNLVSKKEIESMFSTFFEKKLENLMSKMKEQVMKSVNHRIEVLEGDLHDYKNQNDKIKDQNEKLKERVKSLEDNLKEKLDDIETQRQDTEKLQSTIEDTDKAFYGRANELEQYSRRNNVRIWGIPEVEENEDASDTADVVVKKLNETMGVNLNRYDIDIAHRLGKKRKG